MTTRHPEQDDDEIFLSNFEVKEVSLCGYATKRVGQRAYDLRGQLVTGLVPVFVKKQEVIDRGLAHLFDMELGRTLPTQRLVRAMKSA